MWTGFYCYKFSGIDSLSTENMNIRNLDYYLSSVKDCFASIFRLEAFTTLVISIRNPDFN